MSGYEDLDESEIRNSLQRHVDMSEYESQVYLALVQTGKQSMRDLSETSGVPKQRVYDIVEELREQGFVELDDSYPKKAYAVDPTKTLGPIQTHVEQVQDALEEFHKSVSDVDSGVAQFRNRSTIEKYITELVDSAERTIFLMTSIDRLRIVEDALRNHSDVQIRVVLTGLDEGHVVDDRIELNSPIREFADYVRGTVRSEPLVLSVDRSAGFFWPTADSPRQRPREGFYVTDEDLSFLFDRFLSDTVWPLGYPVNPEQRRSTSLPQRYYRIRDCLADLEVLTDSVPLRTLTVRFEGYNNVSGEQITRDGRLAGFYASEFDDRAYLEVDLVEGDSGTTRTVTVGGWHSRREDFMATSIELEKHEDWSAEELDDETLDHIEACRRELPAEIDAGDAIVGFDGYIDYIRSLVGERKSPRMYDEINEFDTLREMVTRASAQDKTLQFEWVESKRLPGGHTAHVGQVLDTVGYDAQLVGFFGQPIREEFSEVFEEDNLLSLGPPTVTEYLQFGDGKMLFTDSGGHQALNWETLREYVPLETLANRLDGSDIVSIGGWALIPEISTIWEGIYEQVFPRLSSPPNDIVVCTSDVDHLTETTLRSDLESLGILDDAIPVTVVTTSEQAAHLGDVLLSGEQGKRALQATAESLRNEIGVSRFAVTSAKESVLVGPEGSQRIRSALISDPAEEGTFEDHFSAGIALGRAESLSDTSTLALGSAVASYFKQHQETPSLSEIRTFLDTYEDQGAA
ncbi:Sugar-specific transcriptional regulator TrmB [Natronoarchaeum philippinense]|uniref:Sugar-specific transcriptional regulator TrmB n=1 Tax=Natronoarchaeum philippinense TaxID=558529 RepID=A0A285P5W5_NATPI|nr:TrmB family transcriptional regulator sugar-binding domain-containing protein [Natronoarchaeum philippinense]SNZ16838.1 Sugar-specific transcriptional regulator TrmB [Natronoarchaeum philippinense]